MKFEMETLREIWNGEDKSHYEVGPDRDGLQCVEIRYRDEAGKIGERMTFPPEMARLISVALTKCADELSTPNKAVSGGGSAPYTGRAGSQDD